MLDVDRILDEVSAHEGLDDFGHPSFREGLDALVASAEAEADLTPIGRAVLDGMIRASLRNRLRVTRHLASHHELSSRPVEQPIFIVGLSRTGTTALSHLLAADPANRSLLGWEAADPVPPPSAGHYHDDPRAIEARTTTSLVDRLNPGFRAIHHDPPDMPVECLVVLAHHFTSLSISTMFHVPSYDEWLLGCDMTHAYEWHKGVLQVLQSEVGGQWQLKSPGHSIWLDTLVATYPDARFVMTHRDPMVATGSLYSLVESLSGTFTEVDHRASIVAHWTDLAGRMLDGCVDFRERHGDDRFVDVPYRQLTGDPVGTVQAIYDAFDIALDDERRTAITRHAAEHRQGRHGAHRYTLEDYGTNAGARRERFARYLDRFGDLTTPG